MLGKSVLREVLRSFEEHCLSWDIDWYADWVSLCGQGSRVCFLGRITRCVSSRITMPVAEMRLLEFEARVERSGVRLGILFDLISAFLRYPVCEMRSCQRQQA
jgi:hypothetical protein